MRPYKSPNAQTVTVARDRCPNNLPSPSSIDATRRHAQRLKSISRLSRLRSDEEKSTGRHFCLSADSANNLADSINRPKEPMQETLDAQTEIRAILDRLAERFGVLPRDIYDAAGWIDDGLKDLLYEIEHGCHRRVVGMDTASIGPDSYS